jgi:L-2,4-diaminobutyrate decarboxylase
MTMTDTEAATLAAIEQDAREGAGEAFVTVAAEYYRNAWSAHGPVSPHVPPATMASRFDAAPPARGRPLSDILQELQRHVVDGSNRLAHPMAMGHQVSPPLPAAVWAEPVISALNQSLAVREMSPAGTAVEHALIRWLAGLAGLGPAAGGSFTSGGTEANLSGLLAARAFVLPDAWLNGVGPNPPVIVCGEHAHYSVARAAGQLGIGVANVVTVPTREWRMDAAALPAILDGLAASGRSVLAVVASAGSTATGSFDDLQAVAEACSPRRVWLHVDAAHGGSALLSPEHRHRLAGIERADSLAWDPHKMMLLPIPCSVVLVREERLLDSAFVQSAPYLFRTGTGERCPDQGVRSLACSRRFEALKLWVALQRYGAEGIGSLYGRLCRMAAALHERLAAHPSFRTLHAPESNILCFQWAPDGDRSRAPDLDSFNLALREAWNESGAGWITTTVLEGERVLRVTLMNPMTREEHLDALVDGLARTATALQESGPEPC